MSHYKKYKSNTFLAGTLVLTAIGFVNRIIGFFFRIFLSNTIGAEGMGIYQLIFPVYLVCFALCIASFETAISRFVAASNGNIYRQRDYYRVGLFTSFTLSILVSFLLYIFSKSISVYILLEPRCDVLLKILSLSIPLACIHSCLSGYYYGIKSANIPAFSQLIEQIVRVASVYLFWQINLSEGKSITIYHIILGILLSEGASSLFLIISIKLTFYYKIYKNKTSTKHFKTNQPPLNTSMPDKKFPLYKLLFKEIIVLSIPLSANRLILNSLQSAEAILIPGNLKIFGMTNSEALAVYGTLTGMALPFILFPSTLTTSISLMLLPTISEAQSKGDREKIRLTTDTTITFCISLGILFCAIFLVFGKQIGTLVFDSIPAGEFLSILAWTCPFLYLSHTMSSILNGLGKTQKTFLDSLTSIAIELSFVVFLVPKFGILAYLWALLASHLLLATLYYFSIKKEINISISPYNSILKPLIYASISVILGKKISELLAPYTPAMVTLCGACAVTAIIYCLLYLKFESEMIHLLLAPKHENNS